MCTVSRSGLFCIALQIIGTLCIFAQSDSLGFEQSIPVQHMVMAGAQGLQSTAPQSPSNAEKSVVTKASSSQSTKKKSQDVSGIPTPTIEEGVEKKLSKNRPLNQRGLNNWAVDTATSLFSYSSTHLDRDKKNNADLCQLMAWADIQDKLFKKPGALLRVISEKQIDSKAFAVGPPVFLHAEKTLDGIIYWVKVPIMLVLYYPEEQKKGLLQVKIGVATQKDVSPYVVHKMTIEKMQNKKAPEDLLF